jgi:hypothetical protein
MSGFLLLIGDPGIPRIRSGREAELPKVAFPVLGKNSAKTTFLGRPTRSA